MPLGAGKARGAAGRGAAWPVKPLGMRPAETRAPQKGTAGAQCGSMGGIPRRGCPCDALGWDSGLRAL
jgi:hypothetical protein